MQIAIIAVLATPTPIQEMYYPLNYRIIYQKMGPPLDASQKRQALTQ
jgi:hypothetical protein